MPAPRYPDVESAPAGRLVRGEPRRLAAGDEDALGVGQVLGDADGEEAAVERDLAWAQVQALEFGGGGGQQVGLVGRADLAGGGDDQAAGAAAGVLAQLGRARMTEPNSVGERSLPLRIGRASGSAMETSRLVIFSPARR